MFFVLGIVRFRRDCLFGPSLLSLRTKMLMLMICFCCSDDLEGEDPPTPTGPFFSVVGFGFFNLANTTCVL